MSFIVIHDKRRDQSPDNDIVLVKNLYGFEFSLQIKVAICLMPNKKEQ